MERKRSVRRRQKKPFAERAKDHCRLFTAFLFSNVGIIILVALYMAAGSTMFIYIEKAHAKDRWLHIPTDRKSFAVQLWNLSSYHLNGKNRSMFEEEFDKRLFDYQDDIIKAVRGGWPGNDERLEWSFDKAFLYSLTVITTIGFEYTILCTLPELHSESFLRVLGYGNLCTRTKYGKIATIFYAIIGMPLFLLYLSNIGDILAKSFKWIYAKVCLCRICPGVARRRAMRERRKIRALTNNDINEVNGLLPNNCNVKNTGKMITGGAVNRKRRRHRFDPDLIVTRKDLRDYHIEEALENISNSVSSSTQLSDEDLEDDTVEDVEGATHTVTVPITICLMIMIGYILIGSLMFSQWETWSILDGCYFCFISLSSIGFGDFVPGKNLFVEGSDQMQLDMSKSFIVCAIYLLLGMALIAMCFNLMQEQVIYKMRAFKRGIRRCFRCDR